MTTYSYEYRSTVEYRQKVQPVTVCVLQKNLVPPRDQMQLLKSAAVRDLDFFGIATTSTYVGAFNDLYEYVAKTPDAIAAIKFNGKWTYITSGVTSALFVDSVYSDMREKNMSLLQSSLSNSAAYAASKYVFDIGSKATQTITDPYLKAAGLGLTLITSASTYYYVDELSAGMLNQVSSAMNKDESWNVRLPVNRELHFPVSGTDIGPDDQPADIVNKLSSLGIPVSSLTLTGGCSDLTYTVVKGDTLSQIAAAKGLTTQELLDRNSWLTDQGRVSADGKYVLIKPGETLDLAGITFVTKEVYDSITAKYGDTAADGLGLNVVTTAAYNDWKRDAAISAFNLFGQPAISQLAPLSLLSSDVQSAMNSLSTSMSDMGFTDSMQLSVLPSMGRTSSLSYDIAAAYTESMAWQNPLSDSDYEYPWAIDQDIEDYNANLITSMPADFESQMAASVNME